MEDLGERKPSVSWRNDRPAVGNSFNSENKQNYGQKSK
jgi:hypothetical protein